MSFLVLIKNTIFEKSPHLFLSSFSLSNLKYVRLFFVSKLIRLNTLLHTSIHMKKLMFIFLALVMISSTLFATSTGFSRCVADNDCDSGDVCILGDCYTPLECKADAECTDNEVCYRGICISPICIVSAECPTDFICTNQGTCKPKECVGDSFCNSGQICRNYECIDAPTPMALEEEPEPAPVTPKEVSFSDKKDTCPVCACKTNCQPCVQKTCPKLECPTCGPFDGELEIPILLFGLVVVAAIGFFAGKMGGDDTTEDVRLDRVKSTNDEGSSSTQEPDINDEASFRYV